MSITTLTRPDINLRSEPQLSVKEYPIIRTADQEDLDQLGQLWLMQRIYHQKWDEIYANAPSAVELWKKQVERSFTIPTEQIFVAEDETGRIIGYVAGGIYPWPMSPFQRYGSLNTIAIANRARGRGIGKQLAQALLTWFQSEQIQYVSLHVDYRNEIALQLYHSLGFRPYQERLMLTLKNS
ncbi:MAG: GNAT family N-acetyltransferase [Candidatus Hodarchaeota archaeon]